MAFKDTLLKILAGAAEQIEVSTIEAELQDLHDSDVAEWTAICDAGEIFASKLKAKTKSGFVAAVLDGIVQAVQESRAANPGGAETSDTSANGTNG